MNDAAHDHIRSFIRRTQRNAVIIGTSTALVLRFLWSKPVAVGFLAGLVASIVNFELMSAEAFEADHTASASGRRAALRYLLRYSIMFGGLAAFAHVTDFNVIAAFVGLFFVQAILVAGHLASSLHVFSHPHHPPHH